MGLLRLNQKTAQHKLQMIIDKFLDVEFLNFAEQFFPNSGIEIRVNEDEQVGVLCFWPEFSRCNTALQRYSDMLQAALHDLVVVQPYDLFVSSRAVNHVPQRRRHVPRGHAPCCDARLLRQEVARRSSAAGGNVAHFLKRWKDRGHNDGFEQIVLCIEVKLERSRCDLGLAPPKLRPRERFGFSVSRAQGDRPFFN